MPNHHRNQRRREAEEKKQAEENKTNINEEKTFNPSEDLKEETDDFALPNICQSEKRQFSEKFSSFHSQASYCLLKPEKRDMATAATESKSQQEQHHLELEHAIGFSGQFSRLSFSSDVFRLFIFLLSSCFLFRSCQIRPSCSSKWQRISLRFWRINWFEACFFHSDVLALNC